MAIGRRGNVPSSRSRRPTGPARAKYSPKRRGKPHWGYTLLRVVASTLAIALILTGLAGVYLYRQLEGNLTVVGQDNIKNRPERVEPTGPDGPLNILVMGQDSREGKGNGIDGEGKGAGLSDTTILVHLSGDRETAYGVSLPRDALVTRPDCVTPDGETVGGGQLQMFNSAYALGGPTCTVQMVEQLTDIRIDHFVVVDFNGFKKMVDAVDGVPVCIPETVDDPAHDIYLEEGSREISGREALNYVRERHYLSNNGDIGRMKRQQAFIASLINKVVSAGTLANPTRLIPFLDAATSSLTLDDEVGSLRDIAGLGLQFRQTDLDNIQFVTVPIVAYEPDPNRLLWQIEESEKLWKAIRLDKKLPKDLRDQALNAQDTPGGAPADEEPQSSDEPSPSGAVEPTPSGEASPLETETMSAEQLEEMRRQAAEANGLCYEE